MRGRKQQDQKGFSLVEVIVAVVVLALVVTPMLRSLVISVETNAKARSAQRSNLAAQNVMEEYVTPLTAADLTTAAGWTEMTGATGVTGYQKFVEGVVADGRTYNARITLDNTTYAVQNEQKLVDIYNMDLSKDACYVEPVNALEVAGTGNTVQREFLERAQRNHSGTSLTEDYIDKNMLRFITVDVQVLGYQEENAIVQVNLTLSYRMNHSDIPVDERLITMISQEKIFDNGGSPTTEFRNLYLFLRPRYCSITTSVKDRITINNISEVPFTAYIVRQNTGTIPAGGELNYCARVEVNERVSGMAGLAPEDPGSGWQSTPGFHAATSLRGNLGWNLESPEVEISTQMDFLYTRFSRSSSDSNIVQYTSLTNASPKQRLFKVTIELFEETGVEADRYLDENKIFTLNGTKEC